MGLKYANTHYKSIRIQTINHWKITLVHQRSKVAVIVSVVAIVVGAGTFYLVSPLFISTQIDEPLPTDVQGSESYQRFIAMNEDEKMQAAKQMSTKKREEIMNSAAQVNKSIEEPLNQHLTRRTATHTECDSHAKCVENRFVCWSR